MNQQLSVGRLAQESGVKVETIRYYERIGMIAAPPRTSGNHRAYDEGHLARLSFIRRGREVGFTLDEIKALMRVANQEGPVCASVLKVARPHLEIVRHKIAELTALEAMLSRAIDSCTGDMSAPECPVLDMLR